MCLPTPSPGLIPLLTASAPAFTAPPFATAVVVLDGTGLTVGRRAVAAALRTSPADPGAGPGDEQEVGHDECCAVKRRRGRIDRADSEAPRLCLEAAIYPLSC